MSKKVLFLCTGNYYRSRFAEILFNHWAAQRGLAWIADSRGLATELGVNNIGPLSPYTVTGLQARAIPLEADPRFPQQVQADDLDAAHLIIALDQAEHTPYVTERYPAWAGRIAYWQAPDLHAMSAPEAFAYIEKQVLALLDQCADDASEGGESISPKLAVG